MLMRSVAVTNKIDWLLMGDSSGLAFQRETPRERVRFLKRVAAAIELGSFMRLLPLKQIYMADPEESDE